MLAIMFFFSFFFQYYEMSYGLNIEMHKQVCIFVLVFGFIDVFCVLGKIKGRESCVQTVVSTQQNSNGVSSF